MFCMGCGAEIRPHARVCVVCGRPVTESPASVVAPTGGRVPSTSPETYPRRPAEKPVPPPPLPLARPYAPSIDYGDTRLISVPKDAAGRLVLVLSLLLCADLFAPWVAFDGTHVVPARFFVPSLLVTGLFAVAMAVALYTPFRQAPYYAAYPVVLGAAAFGGAALLALIVGPLATPITSAFIAHILADAANNGTLLIDPQQPPSISLAADTGLYVFLIGSAILTVAGYQLLILAASARPAMTIMAQLAPAALLPLPAPELETATVTAGSLGDGDSAPSGVPFASPADLTASHANGGAPRTTPASVILPGSDEWTRTPNSPNIARNAPQLRGLGNPPRR